MEWPFVGDFSCQKNNTSMAALRAMREIFQKRGEAMAQVAVPVHDEAGYCEDGQADAEEEP